MSNARPTVERRQLGLTLRRCRDAAGKLQLEAAQHIGTDDARVSRVEEGLATLSPEDLERLLSLYGVEGGERETVLALGAAARKRQPRRAYVDSLPGSFQRFAEMEAAASTIYCYEHAVVPGLLQCPGYVQALFHAADDVWWESSGATIRDRASFRYRRQEATWRSTSNELHFVLGEAALDDVTGGPDVMAEQYRHLLDVINGSSAVTIRKLPTTTADNPARGGGLTVLEFEGAFPEIAFASVVTGPAVYFDDAMDTAAMLRTFHRLNALALSAEDTEKSIVRKLERL